MGVGTKAQAAADKIREDWYKRVNKSIEEAQKLSEANYRLSLKELDVDISRLKAEEDLQLLKDQTYLSTLQSNRLQSQQLDFDRANLLLTTQFKDLRQEEVKYAQDVMTIRAKYAEQEYEIATFATMDEQKKKEALEANNALRDRAISQAREALEISRQETEGSQQKGFGRGFDEFIRNMPNQLEIGKQSFNALMSSMDGALSNFVRNGKFNFKDFTRSLIQDMILIQARAQMMSMMRGLYSAFGGGGGSVSLAEVPVPGTSFTGFNGPKANGGSVDANKIGLVGERGPELFVPRSAGTIIPNNQLANAMGGGQTVNYNGPYIASMNAIDTQSGTQFLAKNKNTIWAAYQSANRGVPVSR